DSPKRDSIEAFYLRELMTRGLTSVDLARDFLPEKSRSTIASNRSAASLLGIAPRQNRVRLSVARALREGPRDDEAETILKRMGRIRDLSNRVLAREFHVDMMLEVKAALEARGLPDTRDGGIEAFYAGEDLSTLKRDGSQTAPARNEKALPDADGDAKTKRAAS
ncbi:MAG: hypothetical protein AAF658_04420, partial [Myxococcota bacterium]